MRIIPARQERLRGEVFAAGMIGDDGDASPAPAPIVVLAHVIASIRHLDLLSPEGEGELGAMRLEVAALRDIGRIRGVAHGQLSPQLNGYIRGFLLPGAEHTFGCVRLLMVDVVADLGFRIGGDFGTAAPPLALRAVGEVGPREAQGRQRLGGQGKPVGELLGAGRRGVVGGQIRPLRKCHLGLAGLALLGRGVKDFLDHLGEGAADLEPFGPGLQLATQLMLVALIQGQLPAGRTEVGTALEPGAGGLHLPIGSQQFACDEAEVLEESHTDGQGGLEGLCVDETAEELTSSSPGMDACSPASSRERRPFSC